MVTGALGAFVVAWKVASEVRSFFLLLCYDCYEIA